MLPSETQSTSTLKAYLFSGLLHASGGLKLCWMQDDWRGFTGKVSDFGLSRLLPESHVQLKDKMATEDVAGTVTHMAPELLSGDPMSAAADVYAFAILSKLISSSTYCDIL